MKIRQFMTGGLLCLFAVTASAARAQDHGQDQNQQSQDQHGQYQNGQDHYNQDHHDPNNYGFNDHDRQVSREWYNEHHDHPPMGLRERDRLSPEYEARLHEGYVFDHYMRSRMYPVPADYYRRLPPPPRGYRYVFVGGHAVLIDGNYRVHDVIHFELGF